MLTQDVLDGLVFIPKLLGEPVYPGGFPVQTYTFKVQTTGAKSLSIKQRIEQYYQVCFTENGKLLENPPLSDDDFQVLRQWLIYVVHAPIWQMNMVPEFEEFMAQTLMIKTWADLSEASHRSMDFGLDLL